jgi:hypothetical protein
MEYAQKRGCYQTGVTNIVMSLCKLKMILLHTVFAFMLIGMSSCVVGKSKHIIGEPFNETRIKQIQRAETTKKDILKWFGPPVAIARQGTTMTLPPPGLTKEGYEEVSYETFFELFDAKHEIIEGHIIYYYYYREIKGSFAAIGPVDNSKQRLVVSKLWILINDTTGIVEDYLLRVSE